MSASTPRAALKSRRNSPRPPSGLATALPSAEPAVTPQAAEILRILVATHSDPRFAKGGAEIAAFQLFTKLSAQAGCSAWFLGCRTDITQERAGAGITQPFSDKEFIYTVGQFNWFNFANRDAHYLDEFEKILDEISPHIIHLHHYANFGVETLSYIRRRLPAVRIVLTLHEFLAICNHFGQ